jgi:hypothetical protein
MSIKVKYRNRWTFILAVAVILLSAILFSNCATIHFVPQPTEDQETLYVEGYNIAISSLPDSEVAIFGFLENSNLLILHVRCLNTSEERYDFIPESVSATGYLPGKSFSITVHEPESYIRRIKTARAISIVLLAVSAAIEEQQAQYSTTYGRGNVYYGGYYVGSYTYSSTTYDPGAAAALRAQNRQELQQTAAIYKAQTASLEARLVRRTTLLPGAYIEGDIAVRYKGADRYVVTVPMGSEKHVFHFVTEVW